MMQSEPSNARQVLGAFAAAALLVAGPAAAAKPSVNSYQAAKAEEAEFERIIKERSGGKLPTISLRSPAEAAKDAAPAADTPGANPFSFFGGVKDAVKGKVEEVAPTSTSDAAASLKDAVPKLPSLAPENPSDAATAAKKAAEDNPFKSLNPKVFEAVKDKVEDAVPSGAASSLKEAMSSAKDALPGSAADAAGAAVGAVKENPVSGFFGAAKEKVEDAVPSDAASGVKEALSSAQSAVPDSAGEAAGVAATTANITPFGGLFSGGKEPASAAKEAASEVINQAPDSAEGTKGAAPSDVPSSVEQAASDVTAPAPEGLQGAAGAAKEAAAGAAESSKEAAPSNPFSGFFGGAKNVGDSVKEVATDGTDMVESGGEAGVPKLPPPPPEPTAAQADKVAVQESAETAPLALPSNEAPPAPQNSSGGLFSGIFSGAIPCKWAKNVGDSVKEVATDGTDMVESGGEAGVPKLPPPPPEPTAAQADKVAVQESAETAPLALPSNEAPPAPQNSSGGLFSGIFSGASDAKVAAGDAAAGVVGAAKAQAPEGLIESVKDAGASVSKAAEKAVPAADDFFSGILSPGEPSDL
ncbi:hypothetical protein WJX81_008077 [Elliptochloris bilobata]|uniref:Uncharacterized protein n=1 Tax=Elliptochloris bilobata TaxID=381761 RepID=A0AAW1QJH2_9CHLO